MNMLDFFNSGDGLESNSAIFRNIFLGIAAIAGTFVGLPLAAYRSWLSSKQLRLSERGQRDEKFQRGAEMLGSPILSSRLGGVYSLKKLARENPEDYLIQILELLCAFSRHRESAPAEWKELDQNHDLLSALLRISGTTAEQPAVTESDEINDVVAFPDVEASVNAISNIRANQMDLKGNACDVVIDLHGACLKNATIIDCNLHDAILRRTNFANAHLFFTNFSGAKLRYTNFLCARLPHSNFKKAVGVHTCFIGAFLSHANFSGAQLYESDFTNSASYSTVFIEADLLHANFSSAVMRISDFTNSKVTLSCFNGAFLESTNFSGADLSRSTFENAQIHSACFKDALLDDVVFKNTQGLTQGMLDEAKSSRGAAPILNGHKCAETGNLLRWKH